MDLFPRVLCTLCQSTQYSPVMLQTTTAPLRITHVLTLIQLIREFDGNEGNGCFLRTLQPKGTATVNRGHVATVIAW